MSKIIVIIPAFNEADSIIQVLESINSLNLNIDIVVIDDGSYDRTRELVIEYGVRCLSHPINCGVGAALITGLTWSLKQGYEQIVVVDADGQHPASDIPEMLAELKNCDLVVGVRNWSTYKTSPGRKIAHSFLRIILKFKYGIKIDDVTSGFRAFRHTSVERLIPLLSDQYLEDTIMLLIESSRLKLKLSQIRVTLKIRMAGKPSHGVLKSSMRYLSVLVKIILAPRERI